jgi:endogenous inhibitor of DNA gyrase (YacG/DUF329 family)
MATRVKCPICNATVPWTPDNPYRPFCSERCKLTDLGAWASGQYALSNRAPEEGSSAEEGTD